MHAQVKIMKLENELAQQQIKNLILRQVCACFEWVLRVPHTPASLLQLHPSSLSVPSPVPARSPALFRLPLYLPLFNTPACVLRCCVFVSFLARNRTCETTKRQGLEGWRNHANKIFGAKS